MQSVGPIPSAAACGDFSELSEDLEQPLLTGLFTSGSLPAVNAGANTATPQPSPGTPISPLAGKVWPQHLRWLLLCLLTVLCAADLLTQYVLVVGSVVQEAPLLPPKWSAWVRDVVGIDAAAAGGKLMLALMRPTCLLALQCALR
jgi:hypothetical protein